MRNLSVLVTALEVIENNLRERFTVEDLAKECYVSVSCLQKLFGYVFGLSVGEYLLKRRLSAATYDLVNTKKSITNIALTYGYTSPEAFSRAFIKFWGVSPSSFRKEHRFSELFPKVEFSSEKGGYNMSVRRKVDITELYDELRKLSGTYVLCADICNLEQTNNTYGYAAGDLIIAEAARRIDSALSDNMLMFRIGRDEFVALTGYNSVIDAEVLARKITELNGNHVTYDGKEIPLSMRIGISKIPNGGLSYKEAFDKMHDTIDKVKQDNVFVGVIEE
ncbi:MAG: helix-turn-helix domain-containing protein [Caldicoprobacterales bacterium]